MAKIHRLDQSTIHQIAAGEVIERPSAVVKELVENAIDAKASAITVEIKQGGISFIRITDNGIGILKEEIPIAFERYATSKILSAKDLFAVSSLGFRGEALASIAAISQVELVTKTADQLTGNRYQIEGGEEKLLEEVGCPDGTTFIIQNLFYNTPARKKFLKSAAAEASYIGDLIEHLAISHPCISFKFVNNNQTRLHTSGNGNLKEVLYHIYGKEVVSHLLSIEEKKEQLGIYVTGFIGKPILSRGNRNFENYFVNERYIRSSLISKAIEEAYKPYMMTRKYPFTSLFFQIEKEQLDVNVHPAKMEVRFANEEMLADFILETISKTLKGKEFIPEISFSPKQDKEKKQIKNIPEPFEVQRRREESKIKLPFLEQEQVKPIFNPTPSFQNLVVKEEQQSFFSLPPILSKQVKEKYRLIGQIFSTYWILEYQEKLFLVDQHAAHEKILYEKFIKEWKEKKILSQFLDPPMILTFSIGEQNVLKEYKNVWKEIGFEIEPFGGKEYAVKAVPFNVFGICDQELLLELIDSFFADTRKKTPEILLEKMASMACKGAVKAKQVLSFTEVKELIKELLELENPYHCPHGRPILISISKYEIEKKFKRV